MTLLYGKTCHLPFEIEQRAYWALRNCNPDLKIAGEKRFLQLHELDELRLQASENSKLYKARTKAYHDRKLRIRKEFKARDKVLLFNMKYKSPKLKPKWMGPYIVKHVFPSGYVELYDKHGGSFIFNGHRIKLYYDMEQMSKFLLNIHLNLNTKLSHSWHLIWRIYHGPMKKVLSTMLFLEHGKKSNWKI